MTPRCEICGNELKEGVQGVQRFCGEQCRLVFMGKLQRGTPRQPGRTTAHRRRRRGR